MVPWCAIVSGEKFHTKELAQPLHSWGPREHQGNGCGSFKLTPTTCPWGCSQKRGSPASSAVDADTENELWFLLWLFPAPSAYLCCHDFFVLPSLPGFLFPRCLKGFTPLLCLSQGVYRTLLANFWSFTFNQAALNHRFWFCHLDIASAF